MYNLGLMALEFLVVYSLVPVVNKFWGKTGLASLMVLNLVIANIQYLKIVDLGSSWTGLALGSIAFSSNFLVTDVISRYYSASEARKAVTFATFGYFVFFVVMQVTLAYRPGTEDWVNSALKTVFGTDGYYVWFTIGGIMWYWVANTLDTCLYSWMVKRGVSNSAKGIYVKSVVSGLTNLVENFFFGATTMIILPYIVMQLGLSNNEPLTLGLLLSSSAFGTVIELVCTLVGPLFAMWAMHSAWAPVKENTNIDYDRALQGGELEVRE